MSNRETTIFLKNIEEEMKRFYTSIINLPKNEMYASHFVIHYMEEIYDYLRLDCKNLHLKYLPNENIVKTIYNKFIDTPYGPTYSEIKEFVYYYMEDMKLELATKKSNEM